MIWLVCYAHLNFSCALIFQHTQIADPHISLQDETDLRCAVSLRSVCEGNFNILINRLAVPVALFYFFLRIAVQFRGAAELTGSCVTGKASHRNTIHKGFHTAAAFALHMKRQNSSIGKITVTVNENTFFRLILHADCLEIEVAFRQIHVLVIIVVVCRGKCTQIAYSPFSARNKDFCAPAKNLGVIIIDEEQDAAYRSEQSPRYHARDVAKYRAAQTDALLVLGSATPSVETYYGAKQGKYPVFALTERFLGAGLPEVIISDMRGLAREGRSGIIGPDLERELISTLEKGKQAILFLNRRGNSRVIGCGVCGWVPECPSCSTTMTYHSVSGRAMCHYCGASVKITGKCPTCGSTSLFTETPGTQKLEEELHERFPSARVLRMDADTMTAKGAHERLLNQFGKGEADILIGTQMVTKGLDFENVTLVGVLDADQSLYAQDYRAHERTFSLVTQVVGRAGRRFDTGRAVIQTYSPLHPVILTAARQDYEAFYESEMQTREALRCPPVCDITMITAVGELEQQVLSSLLALKTRLQSLMEGQFADVKAPVLGPAAAQMVKVMGRYRYHLTIRAKDCARWRRLISGVLREFMQDGKNRGVTVFADSNNEM